jgi:hypothetical protein
MKKKRALVNEHRLNAPAWQPNDTGNRLMHESKPFYAPVQQIINTGKPVKYDRKEQ